jgi:hypothetical protein
VTTTPEATLTALRAEFPEFRIWLEQLTGHNRFIARRQRPGTGLHTVVTSDPSELRATLTAARTQQQPAPATTPSPMTGRP